MTSFLIRWLQMIRRRIHPIHRLRQIPLARWTLKRIDRPWMTHIDGIPHSVAVQLGRNLGTVLSGGAAEEQLERAVVIALAKDNECRSFWDIGANYGLYSFAVRSAVPHLDVEAFEPDPEYRLLLRRTTTTHGLDRIQIHGVAMADAQGTARFDRDLVTGATGGLAILEPDSAQAKRRWTSDTIEVATSTIDRESARLGKPDLIKIDVEGAELEVLRGGRETLRDHKPILLVECTSRQAEVREILRDLGYEIRDPAPPWGVAPGPGMPFMVLGVNPRRHRLKSQISDAP